MAWDDYDYNWLEGLDPYSGAYDTGMPEFNYDFNIPEIGQFGDIYDRLSMQLPDLSAFQNFTPNMQFQPGPGMMDFSGGEPAMPMGTGGETYGFPGADVLSQLSPEETMGLGMEGLPPEAFGGQPTFMPQPQLPPTGIPGTEMYPEEQMAFGGAEGFQPPVPSPAMAGPDILNAPGMQTPRGIPPAPSPTGPGTPPKPGMMDRFTTALQTALLRDPLSFLGAGAGGLIAAKGLMTPSPPPVRLPPRAGNLMLSPEERAMQQAVQKSVEQLGGGEDEVTKAYTENLMKALRGELELDPQLLRLKAEEQANLDERALRAHGTGATTSDWYNKARNDMMQRWAEIFSGNLKNQRQLLNTERATASGVDLSRKGAPGQTALAGLGTLGNLASQNQQAELGAQSTNIARALQEKSDLIRGGSTLLGYSLGGLRRGY